MAITQAQRIREARELTNGLRAAAHKATTQEDWAEVSKKAGALQRRARLLGGLGRGG